MTASTLQRLARALAATGVTAAFQRLLRSGLLVCNYHRIAPVGDHPFDDGTVSATPEAFRQQINWLREAFDTPPVDDIVDRIERRCAFDRPTVLVTFDDGYRDNYEHALPILSSAGVPAVFFVISDLIERPRLPWWDRVAYVLKRTSKRRLIIDYPTTLHLDLDAVALPTATRQVLRLFKQHGRVEERQFFEEFERRAGVELDAETLGSDLFMTWDHLRDMTRAGMRIGSHTQSHRVLAPLSVQEQRTELAESKAAITHAIGRRVESFAYPVGKPSAFSRVTMQLAEQVGYRCAFSYYGGFNRRGADQPFDIRRIGIEVDDELAQVRTRAVLVASVGRGW